MFRFEAALGRFGRTSWLLGASWAVLGASGAPLGLNLGAPGHLLDRTWRLSGSTWSSWAPLTSSWAPLGPNLTALGLHLALPIGLLNAKLWPVHPSVQLTLACRTPCCAPYIRLRCSPWPLERQSVHCPSVCAAHPGLLDAMLCPVHPSLRSACV